MWDQRFSAKEYVYGLQPNDYLAEVIHQVPVGNMLSLGEGEGRNALFLAKSGFNVTALDISAVGLEKAQKLAEKHEVQITTKVQDLSQYEAEPDSWDAMLSVFCHMPSKIRLNLYPKLIESLKPGGYFILEAYLPEQLEYRTGGPGNIDMLISLEELETAFANCELLIHRKVIREVNEGSLHQGEAAVVQLLARKPSQG